jgi:hypothetical protein
MHINTHDLHRRQESLRYVGAIAGISGPIPAVKMCESIRGGDGGPRQFPRDVSGPAFRAPAALLCRDDDSVLARRAVLHQDGAQEMVGFG